MVCEKSRMVVASAVFCLATFVAADEGMWVFGHPPTTKIEASYNYSLTRAWLEHVQKSSVRFSSGGSGSFVSSNGLTVTNHHVAQTCLHNLSTAEHDLYTTGFYARTRAEEAKCPDLELNVLMSTDDVTAKVYAGITSTMAAGEAGAKQRANMSRLESDCPHRRACGVRL